MTFPTFLKAHSVKLCLILSVCMDLINNLKAEALKQWIFLKSD